MDAKLLLGALAILCLGGFAVSPNPGTDFALAFMQNVLPSGGKPHLELLLTSFFPDTQAVIRLPRRYFSTVVSLTAGIPTPVKLPKKVELLSSVRSNMTIRITSNKPIAVVAINRRPYSTGVTVVSPISDWGDEYYIMTPDSKLEGALRQMAIVNGPKPNFISVLLTGLVQLENTTYLPGEQLSLTLGPWESVQLQSNQSLTSSHLVSQEDVAVFAGLGCAGVHRLCNHVYIQLPAVIAWGSNFWVPPLPFQNLCKLTILSASDTVVKLIRENGTTDVMVAPGMVQEFEVVPSTSPLLSIKSLAPVMVLLYFGENNQPVASWILYNLPPVEEACVAYAIISLPGFNNSILLIVKEDSWNGLELDHKPLHGLQWGSINMTELVYTNFPLGDGYHFITNAGQYFGLATIGIGRSSSYGIPGICLDKEYLLCGFECKNVLCNVLENLSNCVSLSPPTCMAWGERHLLTFHGFHMFGLQFCPQVLIDSQGDELSLLPFSVERESSSIFVVRIRVFGQLLVISTKHPGVVFINDEKLYTPISVHGGGLNVTRFGFLATIVNVSFGLRVIIGDHGFLHLQIARRYYESLFGDCVVQSPKELLSLTAHRLPNLGIACDPMTVEDLKRCDNRSATVDLSSYCQIMSESEIFQSCHLTLDPKPFIESCKSKVCYGESLCSAMEAYALACGINGVHLMGWRNISHCGRQCPRHSHYESCSTNSQASCSETQVFNCDTSLCFEACVCDEGYKLRDESCEPKAEWGCYWQGSHYPNGGEFLGKDCNTRCRCSGSNMECYQIEGCHPGNTCKFIRGLWSCQPIQYVSCTLYSDHHHIAFDGEAYSFNGLCDSRMAGVCSNDSRLEAFEVHIVQELLLGSYVKAVKIAVYGKTIIFSPCYNNKVNVDDVLFYTPYVVGTSLQIYKSNLGADVLQTDFGLMVSFDQMKRLVIRVPDSYLGSVCGLCSSMINHESDEPSCMQYCQGVCINSSNELYHTEANAYCGIIQDPQGAFRDCLQMVNPNPYYEACVNDVYSGFTWCTVLYAYTAACQEAGAEVYPWRLERNCGYECPPNSTYTSSQMCASSCNTTCNVTFHLTCALECQEGCQCDPGYILSGDRCVLPEDCGCYVDGKYWKRGDTFYDDQCQNQCSCLDGEVICEGHNCSSEEQCTIVMGVIACYPLSSTCLASGKSYSTFDGLSYPVDKNYPFVMAIVTSTEKMVDFEVHLKRRVSSDGDLASVQEAILKVYGYTIVLNLYSEGLEVNGNLTHFPVDLDNRIFGYGNGSHTVVETDFGLQLTFNPSVVSLTIPLAYAGKVGGLCGNANALASDDIAMSIENFLSLWRSYTENIFFNESLDEVSTSFPTFDARKDCDLIIQAEGPFQECHGLLDPQNFYNNCLSTRNVNYMQSICASIQNYDLACQWASATVQPWMNLTLCESETPPVENLSLSTSSPPTSTLLAPVTVLECLPNVVPSECLSLDKTSCLFQALRDFPWLDGVDFQSSTECSLSLVKVCSNDTEIDPFSVSVHYDTLGNYSTESLHVEVHGLNIVLPWKWQTGVWVNNMPISLPACLIPGKLQIRYEDSDLILEALYGLVLKYERNGLILIQLPFGYQSYICGQCAQREPHETSIKFTSEVSANESESQCHLRVDKETWTSSDDNSTSPNYCSMFLGDESPFRDCHSIVIPDRFYDACQFHVCQELQSGRNGDYACRDLEEYATLCQLQHRVIKPWRNESFCPFECPPHGTYELCTRTCVQCQNGTCSGPCLEGCNCTDGYLWNGVNCVISDMCSKSIYPAKPKYLNCDDDSPSQSKCRVCRLNFDQILTFGNVSSPLEGNGVFDIITKCDLTAPQWLRVAIHLQLPQTAKLHVFYEQSFITINSTLDVWVNGQLEVLPVSLAPELYISKATDVVILGQPGTMAISFSSVGDLEIKLAESLSTELCGACAFGYRFPNQNQMFSLESWRAEDLS